ncbi:MAG TPA: hypothetical protein VM717_07945 [Chthoniobacterales bacterium]|nr:hypothetical protein [Chthoniobacterales bacterium]
MRKDALQIELYLATSGNAGGPGTGPDWSTPTRFQIMDQLIEEANGPIAKQFQRVYHDTLPWLISFSLGR